MVGFQSLNKKSSKQIIQVKDIFLFENFGYVEAKHFLGIKKKHMVETNRGSNSLGDEDKNVPNGKAG